MQENSITAIMKKSKRIGLAEIKCRNLHLVWTFDWLPATQVTF